MGKNILKSLQQLIMIVFSVVLGIMLSEYIEERKNEKEAELLMDKIKIEVLDNKILLEFYTPYHQEIVQSIDSLIYEDDFIKSFTKDVSALFENALTKGNLMTRTPAEDAWDIAKSHPLVVHFEYEELLMLSRIYNQQKRTYESVPKIIDLLLSSDFNEEEKAVNNLKAFKNLLREIASREEALLNYIYEAENKLDLEAVLAEIKAKNNATQP